MLGKLMKLSALPVLALSLALWGCENTGQVLEPHDTSHELLSLTKNNGYTVVKETSPSVGVVTGVIDANGGQLYVSGVTLTVPAGAVTGPTVFTVSRASDELKASFTATRLLPNDVGAAGFQKPVTITFKYDRAQFSGDETQLKVGWIKPLGGGVELKSSSVVDVVGKKVSAQVSHFSDYGVFPPGFASESVYFD